MFEWVKTYTDEAINGMANHKAKTGDHWVADEMVVGVGGKKAYNWNVMDEDTRYILASHLSYRRDGHAARAAIRKAAEAADRLPKKITTDKWRAYIKPIKDILPEAEHVQSEGMTTSVNNNLSERLQGTFRDRTKTLRGLDNIKSGQRYEATLPHDVNGGVMILVRFRVYPDEVYVLSVKRYGQAGEAYEAVTGVPFGQFAAFLGKLTAPDGAACRPEQQALIDMIEARRCDIVDLTYEH